MRSSGELGMLVRALSYVLGRFMVVLGNTTCDSCGSKDGFACRNNKGHPMAQPHPIRMRTTINNLVNYNEWVSSNGQ